MKTHTARMAKVNAEAARFRSSTELPQGGYVIMYRMRASGWTSSLDEPNRFRPGALAVSETGQVFQATGGEYYNGAAEWSSIFEPAPAVAA